jgi:sortase (surface protein transpeptidase)
MLKVMILLFGVSLMSFPAFAQANDDQQTQQQQQYEEQQLRQQKEEADRRKEKDERFDKRLEDRESDGPDGVGIDGNSDSSLHMSR